MERKRNPADWSTLPETVLVNILEYVPLQERLQQCAFVGRSWASAAGQACTEVKHNLPNDLKAGHMKNFFKWAGKHGQQCSTLELSGARPDMRKGRQPCIPKTKYPLPKLRVLRLHSFTVQELGPIAQGPPGQPPRLSRSEVRKAARAAQVAAERQARAEAQQAAAAAREARILKLSRPAKKLELDWEVHRATEPEDPAAAQTQEPEAALPQGAAAAQGAELAGRGVLLDACRHVTSLQLLECITTMPTGKQKRLNTLSVLTDLAGLTGLRRLVLDVKGPAIVYKTGHGRKYDNGLPACMWQGLTKLTHLDLSKQRDVDAETIQGLTHLTALQELLLLATPRTQPKNLAPLRHLQALSMLEIHEATACNFDLDNASFLSALPKLQHVGLLQYCSLDAQVFSASMLKQLRHLHLAGRAVAAGYPVDVKAAMIVSGNAWEAVLAVLADCTALTELRLSHLHDPRSMPQQFGYQPLPDEDLAAFAARVAAAATAAEADAAAYSALTASTRLQTLLLCNVSLTPGAWAHIFPADQQLPAMRELKLSNCKQALSSSVLSQLVSCCPDLSALSLRGALQLSASVRPLLRLTGLRQLQLLQRVTEDVVGVLAKLTGLEGLETGDSSSESMLWNDLQLAQMYRLKHLTSFPGRYQDTSVAAHSEARRLNFVNQVPPRLMPDVWQQLSRELKFRRDLQRRREEEVRSAEERAGEEDGMLAGLAEDDMAVD